MKRTVQEKLGGALREVFSEYLGWIVLPWFVVRFFVAALAWRMLPFLSSWVESGTFARWSAWIASLGGVVLGIWAKYGKQADHVWQAADSECHKAFMDAATRSATLKKAIDEYRRSSLLAYNWRYVGMKLGEVLLPARRSVLLAFCCCERYQTRTPGGWRIDSLPECETAAGSETGLADMRRMAGVELSGAEAEFRRATDSLEQLHRSWCQTSGYLPLSDLASALLARPDFRKEFRGTEGSEAFIDTVVRQSDAAWDDPAGALMRLTYEDFDQACARAGRQTDGLWTFAGSAWHVGLRLEERKDQVFWSCIQSETWDYEDYRQTCRTASSPQVSSEIFGESVDQAILVSWSRSCLNAWQKALENWQIELPIVNEIAGGGSAPMMLKPGTLKDFLAWLALPGVTGALHGCGGEGKWLRGLPLVREAQGFGGVTSGTPGQPEDYISSSAYEDLCRRHARTPHSTPSVTLEVREAMNAALWSKVSLLIPTFPVPFEDQGDALPKSESRPSQIEESKRDPVKEANLYQRQVERMSGDYQH
ncbi:MAG: hypothetical protein HON70_45445 [Lentisphaerae bacterium]|nr:hypothetical protein [Lentisphaerota bacterium]